MQAVQTRQPAIRPIVSERDVIRKLGLGALLLAAVASLVTNAPTVIQHSTVPVWLAGALGFLILARIGVARRLRRLQIRNSIDRRIRLAIEERLAGARNVAPCSD